MRTPRELVNHEMPGTLLSMSNERERTYHHGDLRRAILSAAFDAIAAEGPAAQSLRDLARRAGVSHAAPAHHFKDRTGLLTAVAAEGYALFADALAGAPDLRERGVAYVRFAATDPAHFQVMFQPDLYRADDPDLLSAQARATDALRAGVADLPPGGRGEATGSRGAAWSLAHGFATLLRSGNLSDVLEGTGPGGGLPVPHGPDLHPGKPRRRLRGRSACTRASLSRAGDFGLLRAWTRTPRAPSAVRWRAGRPPGARSPEIMSPCRSAAIRSCRGGRRPRPSPVPAPSSDPDLVLQLLAPGGMIMTSTCTRRPSASRVSRVSSRTGSASFSDRAARSLPDGMRATTSSCARTPTCPSSASSRTAPPRILAVAASPVPRAISTG
ncbi:hypothetical protein SMICM17S_01754 [Streptomyces microflavus]